MRTHASWTARLWEHRWLWAAPVFLLTLAVFGIVTQADFVLWDDTLLITSNPDIRGLTLHNIVRAFSTYDPELYIPLTYLSYQVEYSIAYLQPWIYHTTNLFLHATNATLVAYLLFAISRNKAGSLLGGLLFAIHPLQVEAVAWASSRKDLLATLFFLLSLLQYLRFRETDSRKSYYGSLIFFLLSLMAKVVTVTMPVLLLLLDWLEGRRIDRKALTEKLPYFAFSIVFGIIAMFGKRVIVGIITPQAMALLAGKSTLFYLQKLLLPFGLTIVYPLEGTPTFDRLDLLLPWACIVIAGIAVMWSVRKTRVIAFAAAWYFITLAPTFTNVAKGDEIYYASDRYAYIPFVGILLLLAWALARFVEKIPSLHSIVVTLCSIWIAGLSYFAFWQATTWHNSLTLMQHASQVSPRSMAAHINLSVAYRHVGRLDDSVRELMTAKAIKDHHKIYISLAAVEMERKNYDEALRLLAHAEEMPKRQADPEIPYGMGLALMRSGRMDAAAERYRATLEIEPNHSAARNNLAATLLELGHLTEAKAEYTEVLRRDPGFSIGHFNIGLIEEQQGNVDAAIAAFERSIRTSTRPDPVALSHLGTLYTEAGQYHEAVSAMKRSLEFDSTNATSLQAMLGALQKILAAQPDHAGARAVVQSLIDKGIIQSR